MKRHLPIKDHIKRQERDLFQNGIDKITNIFISIAGLLYIKAYVDS